MSAADTDDDNVDDVTLKYRALRWRALRASGSTKTVYMPMRQPIQDSLFAGQVLAEYASGESPAPPTFEFSTSDSIARYDSQRPRYHLLVAERTTCEGGGYTKHDWHSSLHISNFLVSGCCRRLSYAQRNGIASRAGYRDYFSALANLDE